MVDISDGHQFDNGVLGAYSQFAVVVRRNEVFVTVEAEVGYARAAHCAYCCIFCRREALGRIESPADLPVASKFVIALSRRFRWSQWHAWLLKVALGQLRENINVTT